MRLHLTEAGISRGERFDANVGRYLEWNGQRAAGPSVRIGSHSGPLQIAGDHAQQIQNIGADADEIRHLIAGIAEVVRALVPGAADTDAREAAAMSAVGTGGRADRGVLQRFGKWAVSTAKDGLLAAW